MRTGFQTSVASGLSGLSGLDFSSVLNILVCPRSLCPFPRGVRYSSSALLIGIKAHHQIPDLLDQLSNGGSFENLGDQYVN
jgi:hypothetical protein